MKRRAHILGLDQLQDLHHRLEGADVLSVYLDADQDDFGERHRWRIALTNGLREAGSQLPPDQGRAFAAARDRIERAVRPDLNGFLRGKGWVGFATADELIRGEDLPVPMPDLVRWGRGLRVAPYVRALKQARPIVGVIVDSRRARVCHYRWGELTELGHLHGDTYIGDLTDMNISKRATVTTGVRGLTGADAAQRYLQVERDRLMGRVAEEVASATGDTGLVILGGTPEAIAALRPVLGITDRGRVAERPELNFDQSDAEILAVLDEAASTTTRRRQAALVTDIIETARSGGAACLGEAETTRALRQQRVAHLAFADQYRRDHPDRAEELVAAALAQGAQLEEVSREPGAELVSEGDGVGALLHYRLTPA